ncbi:MAG: bifunctional diaminohydroxyphosphoribosylaminopyrimidine deaminase/5-amino-6-(5-phosphoribosylamino)uracil reductase RibD [Candidatus Krumholzibacteria bacterium]
MVRTHKLLDGTEGLRVGREPGPGDDGTWMDRAIDLAWLGSGRTRPNPLVGAVVVCDGRVVGDGYHAARGREHAETEALDRAGPAALGATLYVTLEPCVHYGRTPPCTDRILDSGVRRVVVGTLDPDPRVGGRGIEALRSHGIEVALGVRAERALLLNLPYFKNALQLGPVVTLKMACSLDGRIAARRGSRDTISGAEARRFAHRLRAIHDGVLVGSETLLVDSPQLDCRLLDGIPAPTPVVMDARLRFPSGYRWTGERRPFIVVAGDDCDDTRRARIVDQGGRVLTCARQDGRLDPRSLLESVGKAGIHSLLVEGGAEVFSSFARRGLWDAMHLFVSPIMFGPDGVGMAETAIDRDRLGAVSVGVSKFDSDILISYLRSTTRTALLERLLPRVSWE